MAGEIFVGSVAVGVVPDLRGFNDRMRTELVPSAELIGRDIGRSMSKGISDNLSVTKVSLEKLRSSITDGLKNIKVEIGLDVTKVAADEVKSKIKELLKGITVHVEVDVTDANLEAVKLKIRKGLSGIKVNVEVGATSAEIARTRAKIKEGLRGINAEVGISGTAARDILNAITPGGGGGRGAAAAGGGGIFGGINALIRALPGGASGSVGAVPASVGIPAAILGATALPFLAQMLAGVVPAIGGAGLAGIGIAGALSGTGKKGSTTPGQLNVAQLQLQAAQDRLTQLQGGRTSSRTTAPATSLAIAAAGERLAAAQARLAQVVAGTSTTRTTAPASALSIQAAQGQLVAAQDRLTQLQAGTTRTSTTAPASPLAIRSATERLIADQARLNGLRATGKATAGQLAAAESSVAGAQDRLNKLQAQGSSTTTHATATAGQLAAAHAAVASAQDRLNKLQAQGSSITTHHTYTAAQLAGAQAAVASAQDRLNKLQERGGTVTKHTAASTASLAGAQASLAAAQQRLIKLQANAPDMSAAQAKMKAAFTTLTSDFQDDLKVMGKSFVPVLQNIFTLADQVLGKMTPVFAAAVKTISGPFQVFSDTIIKTFASPQVKSSIQAVATAFSDVMTAFTPDLPGIINSFADAIERIAQSVSKNPKAFADFLNFFFQIGILVLNGIAFLTDFADYIEKHFVPAIMHMVHYWLNGWNFMQNAFDVFYDFMKGSFFKFLDFMTGSWKKSMDFLTGSWHKTWDFISGSWSKFVNFLHGSWSQNINFLSGSWSKFTSAISGAWNHMVSFITGSWNKFTNFMSGSWHQFTHDLSAIWNALWDNTVGRTTRGVSRLMNVFADLKKRVFSWFSDTVNWLVNAGSNIIQGMLDGIKNKMTGIGGWVKNIVVDPVVNAVKHFFGIHSASTLMFGLGANITMGLLHGALSLSGHIGGAINKMFGGWPEALGHIVNKGIIAISRLPAKALHALGMIAGKVGGFVSNAFRGGPAGSGVEKWMNAVKIALMLNNLPDSMAGQVLFQMRTESGGNVNAINLTDINAQRGDPSRGLMQVIGSTFAAYHIPGTSTNIYDPIANIAAAINYARHVYGPSLMSGGMGLGSGRGYDQGGWLPPGVTLAHNLTGRPELVLNHDQLMTASRGGDGSTQYIAHFDGLTGAAIESHVRTAFQAMSLTQGSLQRQGRRSL